MGTLSQDLRLAVRMLGKNPAFTLVVVATLALGIGANTAIFSLMDQVLLRQLPVRDPHELVVLDGPGPFIGRTHNDQTFSYPMYRDFRDGNGVFDGVIGRFAFEASLAHRGNTERVRGELVSGNFFEVLGLRPRLGRTLTPEDDRAAGAHPVVVLSHGYWERRFGADPGLLDQTLVVNGQPMTVVGVGPRGFQSIEVGATPAFFAPMTMKAQMTPTWDDLENRRSRWLNIMARLKPAVSREQAEAGINVLYQQILAGEVEAMADASEDFRRRFVSKHLEVLPGLRGRSDMRGEAATPFALLGGMVTLVLLITCANVANLLLARGVSRQRELAVRLAVGAQRRHLLRQLVVESLVLAGLGGLAGVLVAWWGGEMLLAALPLEDGAARAFSAAPDGRVLAVAAGISLLTGLLFGLLPAWRVSRPAVTSTLKEEAGTLAGAGPMRFRKALVVAQVALSLLLLVGAGLFSRSLHNLRTLQPGFETDGLITFSLDASLNGYRGPRALALYEGIQEQLARAPGVAGVSLATEPLLSNSIWRSTVKVDGYQPRRDEDMNPQLNAVGTGFFAALKLPVVQGREFTTADAPGAPRVAVVNEEFARYFYGGRSPLGRRFGFGRDAATEIEIVGMVKDARADGPRRKVPRWVYIPYAQQGSPSHDSYNNAAFYVRVAGDAAALAPSVRQVVRQADANLPVVDMRTLREQADRLLFLDRLVAGLSSAFGLLASLLAAVGLYGVMSYAVVQRTREIGIRMALGAERRMVLWLVMREVAVMAVLGIVLGLPGAVGLARLVSSQLFGLSPSDPLTLSLATAALALVASLAGFLPARRATRIDPFAALRYE